MDMEKPPLPPSPAFSEPPKYDGPYKDATLNYLNSTTAHGLPSVLGKKRKIQKVFWFLIFWAFMAYAVYQLHGIVKEYQQYHVTVKTLRKHRTIGEFPAVTICNENKLKKSKLIGTPYETILGLQAKYSQEVYGSSPSSDQDLSSAPNASSPGSVLTNASGPGSVLTNASDPGSVLTNASDPGSVLTNGSDPGSALLNITSALTNASLPGSALLNITSALTNASLPGSGIATVGVLPDITTPSNLPNSGGPSGVGIGPGRRKRQAPAPPPSSDGFKVPPGDSPVYNTLSMGLQSDHDYETIFENSKTTDFSDVVGMLRPSIDDLNKYGHQFDDFVLQCTFDGQNCSSSDFKRVYNDVYGNCYTFNYQINDTVEARTTTKFGSQYGLKLSLNIERDEYLGLFAHQYGARITVHSNNITAFPQDHSVSVPVGYYASIAVDTEVTDTKENPYETNCTYGKGTNLFYPGLYSTDNCLNSCLRDMIKATCSCVETVHVKENETRCSISDTDQVFCRLQVYAMFRDNAYPCQHICNEPCQEVVYKTAASYAQWPTDGFDALVGRMLVNKMPRTEIKKYISNNILRVNVFFRTLMYSHQAASPTYTWETLLSNIGGTWGLFVGFSVCTFLEAMEYLIELICISIRLGCKKPKEKVSPGPFTYSKDLK